MVTVKMLKPYYIKMSNEYVRVILAYQYFSVVINQKVYQFVPIEEKEIRIDRKTQEIVNIESKFAFQKGKDIIYITMKKLISLPDFLIQLHTIVKPYYIEEETSEETNENNSYIITELERLNVKRLIDEALDERDDQAFYELVKLL
ncbi:IDEAL domain-containing protein [Virgibacillus sp. W0181]|uniref:IDEAL domain-containing protein n=1 Tax=Virgibacillus sp. W0181 TaxID=3391581 RepID=UPI003F45F267